MLSPFRGLRFGRLQFNSMKASKVMQVVMAAVAVIPLLYGALYLAAFYDPYGALGEVPVAIVNEDDGAVLDGSETNVGNQIVENLEDSDDGMQWNFVSAEKGQEGLENGDYYLMLTIPSNFSEDIASASTDDPHQATLQLECNQSINMLATQLGQTVFDKVQVAASQSVGECYFNNIFMQISDGGETIELAADGADTLTSGLGSAVSGSQTITDSLDTASDGASTLTSGLQTLSDGADTLDDGASALSSGASALSDGAGTLSGGANELSSGTSTLSSGASALSSGVSQVGSAASAVNASVSGTLVPGVISLYNGTTDLSAQTSALSAGATGVSSAVSAISSTANDASMSSDDKVAAIQGILSEYSVVSTATAVSNGASTLATTSPALRSGIEALYAGVVTGTSGSGTDSLQYGTAAMDTALNVNDGVTGNSLVTDASQVAGGAASVASGANSVASGASSVASGTGAIASGAAKALAGSTNLSDGIRKIGAGSSTLTQGLVNAQSGSSELASGLHEGASSLTESTINSDGKSSMMSDPISTDTSYFTKVENYGTGFVPYFISLGLWVGALILSLVCKPYTGRIVASNAAPGIAVWAGFIPMAIIGVVQAILLGVVLQFGLGINVQHPFAYYGIMLITAFVFIAILQLLTAAFGVPGKFLAIILLMLQLTSCAGTFPLETTPDFFQAISPFMPMTYSVQALRQAISGVDMALVGQSAVILVLFGVLCFVATCLVVNRKRTVLESDLHPLITL